MFRLICAALALSLLACTEDESPTGSSSGTITPGLYIGRLEFQGDNAGVTISAEHKFDADKKYRGRAFIDDGTNSCLIAEITGQWTATSSSYTLSGLSEKTRDDCTTEDWTTEAAPDETTDIRNIKAKSFEEYVELDNQPAMWVTFSMP